MLLAGGFLMASRRPPPRGFEQARGATAVYMAVVGLVYVTLLRDVPLGGLLPWVNVVHHYVMPVAVVAEWLLSPPATRLGSRALLGCLAFPLAYLLYALARGAATGWYAYPFLNPEAVGGYGAVGLYVVGIVAAFFGVGWLLFRRGGERLRAVGA